MIPGFTSTGSKRPEILFGDKDAKPQRMVRASGCTVWGSDGKSYRDMIMGLGAVALGYAHPRVTEAVVQAVNAGAVGSLAPVLEEQVADRLTELIPDVQGVRFLKTGAEAMLAALRLARVATGRDAFVACGYHGWIDTFSHGVGVPAQVAALRHEVPFNDVTALEQAVSNKTAAIVVEPVVDQAPSADWVAAIRACAQRHGVVVIVDQIKAGIRLGWDGVETRWGMRGDVKVLGKALGNGFPIAAVCGTESLMHHARETWISSTLATEFVSLAAANAVLDVCVQEPIAQHLSRVGQRLYNGLQTVAQRYPNVVRDVRGIPEFCYLDFHRNADSAMFAKACAAKGLLFKRTAYNFVSYAHDEAMIDSVVTTVDEAVAEICP